MGCRIAFGLFLVVPLVAGAGEPTGTRKVHDTSPRLYPFREAGPDGKWGYIDAKGKVVIDPAYRLALDFVAGRARVSTSERTGYIAEDGRWIFTLPKGWAATQSFSEGLAGFSVGDMYEGKWGFIDKNGRVVIPFQFDEAGDFSNAQAFVKRQDRWFHIDRQGREVASPTQEETHTEKADLPAEAVRTADGRLTQTNDREPFRGSLARVHVGGTFRIADDGPTEWSGGAWYYVNRQSDIVRRVRNDNEGQACGYGNENR